jgi:hypothetical protein
MLGATGLAVALAMGSAAPLAAEDTAGGVAEWKVSRLVHLQYETCDGGRGTIRIKGNTLAYYDQGMPYPGWDIELQPDGSADNTIGEYIHTHRRLRVKVEPGSGPRMITTMNEISLCSFRYVPD